MGSKITLSRAQAFQVAKYLKKNRDELLGRKLTRPQVAEVASKSTGFEVSAHTIAKLCKDFEISPMWVRMERSADASVLFERGRPARYVSRELTKLVGMVEHLYRQLDEPIPDQFKINMEVLRAINNGRLSLLSAEQCGDSPNGRPSHSEVKPIT